jgi:hypothetical protein
MVAAPQRVVQPVGIVQSVRTRVVNDAGGSKRSTNIGWVQQVASQAVNQTGAVLPAAVTGSPQANWSDYADASAHNDYSAQPSAWETASPGTDQGSSNPWLSPVCTKIVDGRNTRMRRRTPLPLPPPTSGSKWQQFACA